MNIVEMQPALLAPSFPVSDTRPSQAPPYLDHNHHPNRYADSRPSSKENRTPPSPERHVHKQPISSQTNRGSTVLPSAGLSHGQASPQSAAIGKKRSADGEVKGPEALDPEDLSLAKHGHAGNVGAVANSSSPNMHELSQQLRTRLTYAMIKVQNGWQNCSLDEVESLASASPRSTTFTHYSDNRHLLSPRAAISAHLARQSSDSSTESGKSITQQTPSKPFLMSPPPGKKGLAPPANIISRPSQQRRRLTPNMQIQTGSGTKQTPQARPAVTQRTPSQNAAMEADAVETLMFMASPNNSGHHSSQFSPVTSAPSVHNFPSQSTPLRKTFSAPTSPKRVAFAPNGAVTSKRVHDKHAVVASLVEKLDEEGDADLNEALELMDRYHATKVTI